MGADKLIGNWTADNDLNLRESGEDPAEYAELERFLPKYTAVFTEKEITIEGLMKKTQVIPYQITEAEGATLRGDIAHGQAVASRTRGSACSSRGPTAADATSSS